LRIAFAAPTDPASPGENATFDMFDAFVSHLVVHDPMPIALAPLIVLAFAAGSYFLRSEKLKLCVTV
jgi:hypothetical protein